MVDENGVAVAGARVELRPQAGGATVTASADPAGQFSFTLEKSGEYRIDAQRLGFFRFTSTTTFRDGDNDLTVTLNHLQEFAESVDVVYSPPAIELDQPVERKELNTVEILTVPYPAPHDLRNALPLFNGVVQDNAGRAHVNGGASEQTNYSLDGFNISDPVTGRFEARLNIDSVQSLDLQTSRFGATRAARRPARWTCEPRWATTGGASAAPISSPAFPPTRASTSISGRPGWRSPGPWHAAAPGSTTASTLSMTWIPSTASRPAATAPAA